MSSNVAIMVVLIVLITSIASIFRARYKAHHQHGHSLPHQDTAEVQRMRDEVRTLKERVAVLERIATDRNHLLEQEFDKLRDR